VAPRRKKTIEFQKRKKMNCNSFVLYLFLVLLPLNLAVTSDEAYFNFFSKDFKKVENGHWMSNYGYIGRRRNHDCQVTKDSVILTGGRFQPSIEVINYLTGKHTLVSNASFLNLHHYGTVFVYPATEEDKKIFEWEMWIPCGFFGHHIDHETAVDHVRIIRKMKGGATNYQFLRGPNLPNPRGACTTDLLYLDGPNQPGHICIFAGSNETHDAGHFHKTNFCYDRLKSKWTQLPSLPAGVDHHSMLKIPEVQCPSKKTVGPFLFIFHARPGPYGQALRNIFSFQIPKADDPNPMKTIMKEKWKTYVTDDHPCDASGSSVSANGRYVFQYGGILHNKTDKAMGLSHSLMRRIRILDVCDKIWYKSAMEFVTPRFAIETCRHPKYPMTCGG
jgi:hypothetical protein